MTTKPKVLVTRGDHDPAAIARLGEFCDLEVCPEPRAMTRYHPYITSARDWVGGPRKCPAILKFSTLKCQTKE